MPDGRLRRLLASPAERFLAHAWRLGATARPVIGARPVISFLCDRPGEALRASLAGAEGLAELVPGDPRGAWLCRVRPGDRLAPHAPAVLAAALARAPEAVAAYADTVRLAPDGRVASVELKPGFDPVLETSRPYAAEPLLLRAGAPPPRRAEEIVHIPYPALLTAAPAATGGPAPTPPYPLPRVSVVIPSRDAPALIARVLAGLDATDYPDLEVIVSDNGSTDAATLAEYDRRAGRLRVLRIPGPFNFAAQVNRGVAAATGEALLLLNNDIEMREPGWLREMVACLGLPGTGIVGARLLFPDGRLQHAGVVLGLGAGHAGHRYAHAPADAPGEMGRLGHRQSLSAVTAACMLVTRPCWEAVGGMDDETFAVAYNDVDFCLRAGAAGHATVWTPHATLIHHEKASRRLASAADRARFAAEKAALRFRHGTDRVADPAVSPWLSRKPVPGFRRLAALPEARGFRAPFDG